MCISTTGMKKSGQDKLPVHNINNFWDIKCAELLKPELRPLSEYLTEEEKLILVVNVASTDPHSKEKYHELMHLHAEFKEHGLEIFAFPCNQFGQSEKGTPQEINDFAKGLGVEFPIFQKMDVNGGLCHPVYNFVRSNSELFDRKSKLTGEIPGNFSKFLIDRHGHVVRYYGTKPIISKELMIMLRNKAADYEHSAH